MKLHALQIIVPIVFIIILLACGKNEKAEIANFSADAAMSTRLDASTVVSTKNITPKERKLIKNGRLVFETLNIKKY
jgi:ABC-type uncharacterized transport system auxiliary subunit